MSISARGRLAFGVVILFGVVAFAGCVGSGSSPVFDASGSGGVYFSGWDYDATTKTPLSATFSATLDSALNTGRINATGLFGNDTVTIRIDNFTGSSDFHDGGIAANFIEHGDSGVGNALLPRMNLLIATWGPGSITTSADNSSTDWVDFYTNSTVWNAHLMVTDSGVRDDGSGRVTKSDGTTAFDPNDPGDARIADGDLEAHLVFTSAYEGDSLPPGNLTLEGGTDMPRSRDDQLIPIPIGQAFIRVDVDMGSDPAELGTFAFQLRTPGGAALLDQITLFPATGRTTGTLYANVTSAGDHVLRMEANVGPGDYSAAVAIVYPPKPVHYFFWEQVTVNKRVVP